MPDLSRCNLCGAVLRVVHYPGWGNEPVKHECRPIRLCHQCKAAGECQARTPCAHSERRTGTDGSHSDSETCPRVHEAGRVVRGHACEVLAEAGTCPHLNPSWVTLANQLIEGIASCEIRIPVLQRDLAMAMRGS